MQRFVQPGSSLHLFINSKTTPGDFGALFEVSGSKSRAGSQINLNSSQIALDTMVPMDSNNPKMKSKDSKTRLNQRSSSITDDTTDSDSSLSSITNISAQNEYVSGDSTKARISAKSLPKINNFTKKKSMKRDKGGRAISEQPPAIQIQNSPSDIGITSPASPSAVSTSTFMTSIMSQQSRTGGLSAYEISPSGIQRNYMLDDFHIVRKIGKGGFATVFLVRMKSSNKKYFALKAIKKADVIKMKQEKQVMNEKNILKGIKHSFIVELFSAFQDTYHLYMVMEYIDGGDLFSYLRKLQVRAFIFFLRLIYSQALIYRNLQKTKPSFIFQKC